jgi:hypothetical protein
MDTDVPLAPMNQKYEYSSERNMMEFNFFRKHLADTSIFLFLLSSDVSYVVQLLYDSVKIWYLSNDEVMWQRLPFLKIQLLLTDDQT